MTPSTCATCPWWSRYPDDVTYENVTQTAEGPVVEVPRGVAMVRAEVVATLISDNRRHEVVLRDGQYLHILYVDDTAVAATTMTRERAMEWCEAAKAGRELDAGRRRFA